MEGTQYKQVLKVGKNFKVLPHPLLIKKNSLNLKNKRIGFDPKLFNENFINKFSNKLGIECRAVNSNLVNLLKKKKFILKKKKVFMF